jgi:hypothetical protein
VASSAVWQIRGFVELMDEEPRHAHRDDAGSQRLQKCLGSLPATTVPVRATVMDTEKTIPAVSPCLFMSCVRAWSSGRHTAKQYSWSCADRALPSGGAPGRVHGVYRTPIFQLCGETAGARGSSGRRAAALQTSNRLSPRSTPKNRRRDPLASTAAVARVCPPNDPSICGAAAGVSILQTNRQSDDLVPEAAAQDPETTRVNLNRNLSHYRDGIRNEPSPGGRRQLRARHRRRARNGTIRWIASRRWPTIATTRGSCR